MLERTMAAPVAGVWLLAKRNRSPFQTSQLTTLTHPLVPKTALLPIDHPRPMTSEVTPLILASPNTLVSDFLYGTDLV